MPPDLPYWTLDGPAHERLFVVRAGATIDADREVMPAGAALAWLDRWLLDERAQEVLAGVHATLFGHLSLSAWAQRDLAAPLRAALGEAIRFGDLLVLERRREGSASGPPDPGDPPPSKPPSKPPGNKTFLEVELLDPEGRRFPARLRVTTPAGAVLHPGFDGFARIEGLDPGTCDVEFPDIDGREWGRSPPGGEGGGPGTTHSVRSGDCISSIAEQHGFLHWRTVWDDAQNEALRAKRPNPNALAAGDEVVVPARAPRNEEAPTGARAVFRVLAAPARLRIAFLGLVPNDWELRVGGKTFTGRVAPGGMIDQVIPATATSGELVLRPIDAPGQEDRWSLQLGALDPVEELRGVQARLNNLAFPCPVDGQPGDGTTAAIAAYQRFRGLPVQDGTLDAATRADLAQLHDG